jgi:hypothetical protein
MWAARNGHEDVIQALVKGGAISRRPTATTRRRPIIAIANDRLDIANLLLDLGADPNDGSLYFAVDQHDARPTCARATAVCSAGIIQQDHDTRPGQAAHGDGRRSEQSVPGSAAFDFDVLR